MIHEPRSPISICHNRRMPVLEVRDLEVSFGDTRVLRGVSFDLEAGQTFGVVGESGCGKSMTGFALMGMLPAGGTITFPRSSIRNT